jgi:hypothetical protein
MTTLELGLRAFQLSAVLSAVAAGFCCSGWDVIGLPNAVFEYHGSEKNLANARSAAEEWNRVCGTHLSVVEPPATGNLPLSEVAYLDGHGGQTRYQRSGGKLPIAVEFIDGPWARSVLVHEMGHVLGKHHDESGLGVMNATVSTNAVVTEADCP